MSKDSVILIKSKAFAIEIIKLYQKIISENKEFVISKQLLKSGTSIGANVREGHHSMTNAEFKCKMNIALKEAAETEYWLELLYESDYINKIDFNKIYDDCNELNKILISIIKSTNKNSNIFGN